VEGYVTIDVTLVIFYFCRRDSIVTATGCYHAAGTLTSSVSLLCVASRIIVGLNAAMPEDGLAAAAGASARILIRAARAWRHGDTSRRGASLGGGGVSGGRGGIGVTLGAVFALENAGRKNRESE